MPPFPASAAGPDLRQLVLGSEGRLGILTDVVLRATPLARGGPLDACALRDWGSASRPRAPRPTPSPACRCSASRRPPRRGRCSRSRAGTRGIRALAAWLRAPRRPTTGRCCWSGRRGSTRVANAARHEAGAIVARHGGVPRPRDRRRLARARFRSPYLRNALWAAGYGGGHARDRDRLVARCPALARRRSRRRSAGASRTGASGSTSMTHLSHLYPSGSSLYLTYLFRLGADPDETLDRWRARQARRLRDDRRRAVRPSATTTASARTTRRTSPPRRARSGWRPSTRSCGPSTRRGS